MDIHSDLARATDILTQDGDFIDIRGFTRNCIEEEGKILEFILNDKSGFSVMIRVGNRAHEYMGKSMKIGDIYMTTCILGMDKPILSYIGMFDNLVVE